MKNDRTFGWLHGVLAEPAFGSPKSFSSMQHHWACGPLPVTTSPSEHVYL